MGLFLTVRGAQLGFRPAFGHRRLGIRVPGSPLTGLRETARRLGVALEANGAPGRMGLVEDGCRMALVRLAPNPVQAAFNLLAVSWG